MEFDIEKCVMLVLKISKQHVTDEKELPHQHKIRTFGENKPYRILGILEADTIKEEEMNEKNRKSI